MNTVTVARRLIKLVKEATALEVVQGRGWYAEALGEAEALAGHYGLTVEQTAAIFAALSPGMPWDRQVLEAWSGWRSILNEPTPVTVHGISQTNWLNVRKAHAIAHGANPADVLSGIKVKAFFRNIMGDWSVVTLDRHAIKCALPVGTPDSVLNRASKDSPVRRVVEQAYHIAAAHFGWTVAELQAVAWVVWRRKTGKDKPMKHNITVDRPIGVAFMGVNHSPVHISA